MARNLFRRRAALIGLAAVLPFALAACGGGGSTSSSGPKVDVAAQSWDAVTSGAKQEGAVTIYSSQGLDQLNDVKAKFQAKYPGITVTVVRAIEGDLQPKIEAEFSTGRAVADVMISASDPWLAAKDSAGFFSPLVMPALDQPAYDKATNLAGKNFVVDGAVLTFGWNTKLHPGAIKDYPDLLDPSLKGKIGVVKPSAVPFVDFYLYLEKNYGADFVSKLAAQKPQIYPSSLPMAQALTSGEISAATFVQPLVDEKAAGAPVDWGLADPAWGSFFKGVVLAKAPHPRAAQLLADFLITPEGQAAIARKAASVLPNVPGAVGTTKTIAKQDLTALTPEKVREYQTKWDKQFT
ncbi:MAG: putative Fe3+ transporter, periplasmic component [Frankiales bacterium]|nr:putative Fe3+ transporter, periplasmic component [Frankiales bacterium]